MTRSSTSNAPRAAADAAACRCASADRRTSSRRFSARLLQRRAEIDGQRRDHDRRDERDQHAERAQDGMRAALRAGGAAPGAGAGARRPAAPVERDGCRRATSIRSRRARGRPRRGARRDTATSLTRPAFGERSSFSIFIASTTTTRLARLDLVARRDQHADDAAGHRRRRPVCSPCARAAGSAPPRPVRRPLTDTATVRPVELARAARRARRPAPAARAPLAWPSSGKSSDRPKSPTRCASTIVACAVDRRRGSGRRRRARSTRRGCGR